MRCSRPSRYQFHWPTEIRAPCTGLAWDFWECFLTWAVLFARGGSGSGTGAKRASLEAFRSQPSRVTVTILIPLACRERGASQETCYDETRVNLETLLRNAPSHFAGPQTAWAPDKHWSKLKRHSRGWFGAKQCQRLPTELLTDFLVTLKARTIEVLILKGIVTHMHLAFVCPDFIPIVPSTMRHLCAVTVFPLS